MPKASKAEFWCVRAPDSTSVVFDSLKDVVRLLQGLPNPREYQVFVTANDRHDIWEKNENDQWHSHMAPWFKSGMIRNIGPVIVTGTTKKRLVLNTFTITKKHNGKAYYYVCFRTGYGKKPKVTINLGQVSNPNYDLAYFERTLGCSLDKLNAIYMAWEIWSQTKKSESFEDIYKDT